MTDPVARQVVEAFYRALSMRDMDALAGCLDENVRWTISGPVDILPFCGQRVGKAVVMKLLCRDLPALLAGRRLVPTVMLVDGDRASVLGKLTATKREGGHAISYRTAHFMQFRDNKLVEYISIIDSFDAVEQVLGRALDVHDGRAAAGEGNLIAI
jgi:ketosteroid isomerase-like protein